ncbi:hypothetical protein [uncultured Aquimarina sp.]|uniref:hypothetical protein n=1 Tax=uncultured Aquimarina sp. TaxID=575652 RepID=UPI002607FE16|nr:hypothetical protein [uncultured Aquimarina sp.]
MKIVNVTVPLSKDDSNNIDRTLELRYLLADTIEARGLGELINEGTGDSYIDIAFVTEDATKLKPDLESLLLSLGFTGENQIDVEDYEE